MRIKLARPPKVFAVKWRGFLIFPMFFAIIFFAFGENGMFRLSDPLDFLATGLGVLTGIAQVIIWITWLLRSKIA
jgi:hypothetical protein